MRAESGHMAVVEHNDLVCMPDRRHALRDQHDCGFPRKLRQRLAQRCVRREVQRGGAVVQNEKLGPAYKRAGDGQPLAMDEAAKQVKALREEGYREIVVTGIEISSYGSDFKDGTSLIDLLELIAREGGDMRIRLGSLEPRTITEEFCKRASKLPYLCPHFHLSMQSGCDATLKRMNRKYDTARYMESCDLLRQYFDDPAITTDLITGFPEETEEEFAQTLDFIARVGFADMHVFPYSIRPGTKAAEMRQIDMPVREERAARASAVAKTMHEAYLACCVGKIFPVLFERDRKGGSAGHAPNYMEVSVAQEGLHNQVKNVKITAVDGGSLRGELEE